MILFWAAGEAKLYSLDWSKLASYESDTFWRTSVEEDYHLVQLAVKALWMTDADADLLWEKILLNGWLILAERTGCIKTGLIVPVEH
jgi:hypothetical protein